MGNFRLYLVLHFIVLIWGFTGVLGMLMTIPAVEVVFYRTLVSAIVLAGYLVTTGRSFWDSGPHSVIHQLGTGTLIAAHWILFFLSARVSNVSVCLAGMATCSLWTALIEPIYYRRKIQAVDVILSLVAVMGMVIIFRVEFQYWLGLLLAILSALLASIFTIINARFIHQGKDPFVITFYEMLGATIVILLFFPIYAPLNRGINLAMSGMDFLWIGILAIVCTVFAYSISVKIMKDITPFVMNLTVNLEPVYGIVLAVLVFGESEKMSHGFYAGTMLILMAVLAYPLINRIRHRKPLENRHSAA